MKDDVTIFSVVLVSLHFSGGFQTFLQVNEQKAHLRLIVCRSPFLVSIGWKYAELKINSTKNLYWNVTAMIASQWQI